MVEPVRLIEAARRAFTEGDLVRSIRLCDDVSVDPDHAAEALLLKGRALLGQEGHGSEALAAFQAVADDGPHGRDARDGEVEALLRLGQIDAAENRLGGAGDPRLERVVAALRGQVSAAEADVDGLLLGQTLNAVRAFDQAEAVLAAALDRSPEDPALWLARTRTFGGLGRIDDILEACRQMRDLCFRRSIGTRRRYLSEVSMLCRSLDQVRPDHALTLALLGGVCVERTATEEEGRQLINRANRTDPDVADQYLSAAVAELRGGVLAVSQDYFERAQRGMAAFAEPAAMAAAVRAAQADPVSLPELGLEDAPAALLMISEGLGAASRYAEALEVARTAVETAPDSVSSRNNLVSFLSLVGRTEESYAENLEACRLAPDDAAAKLNLASNLMAMGRLGEAWDLYEHRLANWRKDSAVREFPIPQWDGQPLEGATVLVWREEGVGDELRGASTLPDLISQRAGRIVFECDPRWRSIFQRSFPGVEFRDENLNGAAFEGFDFHIPLMSLWRWYRRQLEDFPRQAYLVPDPERVAHWRRQLEEFGAGPKIGIGWKSLNPSWRKRPLLTALADWDAIVGREDLVMINLQCEGHEEELAAVEARVGRPVHALADADLKMDLETAIAVISALDAVVGARCWVPTTAGALGTKAFTISPKPNPFMADQDFDPWSENGDVFYRDFKDDWTGVVNQVNMALDRYLASDRKA